MKMKRTKIDNGLFSLGSGIYEFHLKVDQKWQKPRLKFTGARLDKQASTHKADAEACLRDRNQTFLWQVWFPDSKQAIREIASQKGSSEPTVSEIWRDLQELNPENVGNLARAKEGVYRKRKTGEMGFSGKYGTHTHPRFGDKTIEEISVADIEKWIFKDMQALKDKRNYISPLSKIIKRRMAHRGTDATFIAHCTMLLNAIKVPTKERIANNATMKRKGIPVSELVKWERYQGRFEVERDMEIARFYSGFRISEFTAMGWENMKMFDDSKWLYKIRASLSTEGYATPKTKSSRRDVPLNVKALEALQRQFKRTGHLPPVKVFMPNLETGRLEKVEHRPIWINERSTKSTKVYDHTGNLDRTRHKICEQIGAEYHSCGETRHGFFSMLAGQATAISKIAMYAGNSEKVARERYVNIDYEDANWSELSMEAETNSATAIAKEKNKPQLKVV